MRAVSILLLAAAACSSPKTVAPAASTASDVASDIADATADEVVADVPTGTPCQPGTPTTCSSDYHAIIACEAGVAVVTPCPGGSCGASPAGFKCIANEVMVDAGPADTKDGSDAANTDGAPTDVPTLDSAGVDAKPGPQFGCLGDQDCLAPCQVGKCAAGACAWSPLPDDATCTGCGGAGKCSAGQCNGGADLLWDKTFPGSDWTALGGVTALADGGFAAGGVWVAPGGKAELPMWMRVDATGKLVWQKKMDAPPSGNHVFAPLVHADGSLTFPGEISWKGAGKSDFWLLHVGADGTAIWDQTFGTGGQDDPGQALLLADESIVMVGGALVDEMGQQDGLVVRVGKDGKALWQKQIGKVDKQQFLRTVTIGKAGDIVAMGDVEGTMTDNGLWLVRLGLDGTVLADVVLPVSGQIFPELVQVQANGDLLVVSEDNVDLQGDMLGVRRLTAAGSLLWTSLINLTGMDIVHGALPGPDGGATLVYGANGSQFLARVNQDGGLLSNQALPGAIDVVRRIGAVPGGGLILSGHVKVGGNVSAWLRRTDAWGAFTCTTSGGCFGQASVCSDGNPCTGELCSAASGCSHNGASDSSPCGSGQTCKVAVCGP